AGLHGGVGVLLEPLQQVRRHDVAEGPVLVRLRLGRVDPRPWLHPSTVASRSDSRTGGSEPPVPGGAQSSRVSSTSSVLSVLSVLSLLSVLSTPRARRRDGIERGVRAAVRLAPSR